MSRSRKQRSRQRRQSLYLLDADATRRLLRERLSSRQWWAFVSVGIAGLPFVAEVEARHFGGRANADFEILALPPVAGLGIVSIALARKSRLTARQLAKLFDECDNPHQAEEVSRGAKDVLILTPAASEAELAAVWITQFIRGETQTEEICPR